MTTSDFEYSIDFDEPGKGRLRGSLHLEKPYPASGEAACRHGRIKLDSGAEIEINLTHSAATAAFIYTQEHEVTPEFFKILGLPSDHDYKGVTRLMLPGQLVLGADRTPLVARGVVDTLSSPPVKELMKDLTSRNIVTIPVLREGIKYRIADALCERYGYYCDEVITDAHHTFDDSVSTYLRSVKITLFKDDDISDQQRRSITTAFIGDSIASGTVLLGVIDQIREKFERITRIEVVAPFATVRGLARIASYCPPGLKVRFHVFETLLNALPPEFYYSAHFPESDFHIRPDLQKTYEEWWGTNSEGNRIADTACAGYGWSEAFFAPRKQIEMINEELHRRHNLSLLQILYNNLKKKSADPE